MHDMGIAPSTAHYGNLHEDYHSVAANPSFTGHGTWFFLHGSLRIIKQSHPQPSPRLKIPDQDYKSSIIVQAVYSQQACKIRGEREGWAAFKK